MRYCIKERRRALTAAARLAAHRYWIRLGPALLLGLAACGSSASLTSSAPSTPADTQTTAPPATSAAASTPADSGATASTPAAAGASTAATITYTDSNGDSVTETYSIGVLVPETQLPDVQQQADSCTLPDISDSTNLVVPVTVTTTLSSSVSLNATLLFTGDAPGVNPSDPSATALITTFVYQYAGGYSCNDMSGASGGVGLSLTPGQAVVTNAWVILDDAISPNYPTGNPNSIGMTLFIPHMGIGGVPNSAKSTISGPAVCTSAQLLTPTGYALRIGGTQFSWMKCNGNVSY